MLKPQQNATCEVVVQLCYVNVLWSDTRHLVGVCESLFLMRHVPPVFALHIFSGIGLAHARYQYQGSFTIFCTIGRGNYYANATIADQATVQQVQWLDDPARVLMILDGDRLAHDGVWIHRSVLPAGDSDLPKLATGSAVERHVSRCGDSTIGTGRHKTPYRPRVTPP